MPRKPGKCVDCGSCTSRKGHSRCLGCSLECRGKSVVRPLFLVDERFEGVAGGLKWRTHTNGYVVASVGSRMEYLHRLVWKAEYGWAPRQIDHINRNRLDNRLENLRPASGSLNNRNKQSRGVRKIRERFFARIKRHGKEHSLGGFGTEKEALAAHQNAKQIIEEFEALESL